MRQFLLVLALTFGLMPLPGQTTEPLLFFPVSPYLQNMSSTAVTVMYQSGGSVHSWVEMGRDSLHTTVYRQLEQLDAGIKEMMEREKRGEE